MANHVTVEHQQNDSWLEVLQPLPKG